MPYCDKHNREKLPSKFPDKKTGEKAFWCPDCYDEWKKSKQGTQPSWSGNPQKSTTSDQMIFEELAAINKRIDKLGKYLVNKLDDIYNNLDRK